MHDSQHIEITAELMQHYSIEQAMAFRLAPTDEKRRAAAAEFADRLRRANPDAPAHPAALTALRVAYRGRPGLIAA